MKKLIVLLIVSIFGFCANAQMIYTPYNYKPQQNNDVEKVRTIAYRVDFDGNINKLPIKIEISHVSKMVTVKVVEYYSHVEYYGSWSVEVNHKENKLAE